MNSHTHKVFKNTLQESTKDVSQLKPTFSLIKNTSTVAYKTNF